MKGAEVVLGCADLGPTLRLLTEDLGFRVETIFPADDPREAVVSGHGLRLRLTPDAADAGLVRIPGEGAPLTAPNGTRIEWFDPDPPVEVPPFRPEFILTRADEGPAAGEGRAGMIYRDLIPGRLGGCAIASHISVPGGGPVADWPHFHKIAFQIIFCRRGRARLVYEDQGEPFWMEPGDCVLQPPRIRHRVLETADDLEVVELTSPALHETLADHELALPTGKDLPDRDFGGQRFALHRAIRAPWLPLDGFQVQNTDISDASGGAVEVRVLRPGAGTLIDPAQAGDGLLFGFVLEGTGTLGCHGRHPLHAGDAFVVPPGETWVVDAELDLRLLEVRARA